MSRNRQVPKKTLVADARLVAEQCAGLNVRLATRQISRFLDAQLAPAHLSLAQFSLLIQIAAARDDTIGSLAERSGLDQSTLSRNLRPLQAAGLVEIVSVETDLRRRAVWLTEQGAVRLETAMSAWRRAHRTLSGVVDPELLRRLVALTRSL